VEIQDTSASSRILRVCSQGVGGAMDAENRGSRAVSIIGIDDSYPLANNKWFDVTATACKLQWVS
jgi:hypothetical protein